MRKLFWLEYNYEQNLNFLWLDFGEIKWEHFILDNPEYNAQCVDRITQSPHRFITTLDGLSSLCFHYNCK